MERKEMVEEMLRENPNDAFLNYAAALEYKKSGELDKSIVLLEKLSVNQPDYLPLYYQLGKLYEETKSIEAAASIYKLGIELATQRGEVKTKNELHEALEAL